MLFDEPYRPRHGSGPEPLLPWRQQAPSTQAYFAEPTSTVVKPETGTIPVVETTGASEPAAAGSERAETTAAENARTARSSVIMAAGTLVSRILGMIRSPLLLIAVVGVTSPAANSFSVANRLPTLISVIVAGGLVNAVLVPAVVRASKASDDNGHAFINKLLTISMVILGAITALLTLSAPLLVKLFAGDLDPNWHSVTVLFAFWSLPQIFFYGMFTILGQILNARENFGPYMWAPALNNVVAILGLLLMLAIWGREPASGASTVSDWQGIRAITLAGLMTLGIAAQALVLIIPLRKLGFRYRPDFKWRNSGLGAAGKASMWVLAAMLVGVIPTIGLTNAASGATQRALDAAAAAGISPANVDLSGVANAAVYDYAYAIYSLPTSLITVSIATAMFTRLAKAAISRNYSKVRADTSLTIRTVAMFNFLATAGILALAVPGSRILGAFSSPAEVLTLARVMALMSLGLVGLGTVTVLQKVYYALEDTRGAFFIGLPWQLMGIVGYAIAALLPPEWVVPGIALVMSATNTIAAVVMFFVLRRRFGGLDGARILRTHLKLGVVAVLTGLIGFALVWLIGLDQLAGSIGLSLLTIIGVGGLMVACYVMLMRAFKLEEAKLFLVPLQRISAKLRRR